MEQSTPSASEKIRALRSQKSPSWQDLRTQLPAEINAALDYDYKQLAAAQKSKAAAFSIIFPGQRLKFLKTVAECLWFIGIIFNITSLGAINAAMIDRWLNRERPIRLYKGKATQKSRINHGYDLRRDERKEVWEFFERAKQYGWVNHNPVSPGQTRAPKLTPQYLSPNTQQDLREFEAYLQRQVDNKLLSPKSADRYLRDIRILLHDAEQLHQQDPNFPSDLDGLFSDPKYLYRLILWYKNRGASRKKERLARASVKSLLSSIRQPYRFLHAQNRTAPNAYEKLLAMFKDDTGRLLLPGRGPKIIEALTEDEIQRVFACLEELSTTLTLKLRDLAMIQVCLDTTVRIDGLNSMCIENFRQAKQGIFEWLVRVKRSARKTQETLDQIDDKNELWRDWYMSPRSAAAIEAYLKITGRSWADTGPVWLTEDGRPLSKATQQTIIKKWLSIAGCRFTRPHVLRHTGISRLVNVHKLPLPVVQAISQHKSLEVLIQIYARQAKVEAFDIVNQLYPAADKDDLSTEQIITSVGTTFNEISAGISRRRQEKRSFNHRQAEELLDVLRHQIQRLATHLGYEASADIVALPVQDYVKLRDVLQLAGLTFEEVLGYEPAPSRQLSLTRTGRKPKSLISEW